jgi:hypothetical protein
MKNLPSDFARVVDVGTGYGKTLCMILPCLLDFPGTISTWVQALQLIQMA